MQKLNTWANRSEFKYMGSVSVGSEIYFGNKYKRKVRVTPEQYSVLVRHFSGNTVDIGTSRDMPQKQG